MHRLIDMLHYKTGKCKSEEGGDVHKRPVDAFMVGNRGGDLSLIRQQFLTIDTEKLTRWPLSTFLK